MQLFVTSRLNGVIKLYSVAVFAFLEVKKCFISSSFITYFIQCVVKKSSVLLPPVSFQSLMTYIGSVEDIILYALL